MDPAHAADTTPPGEVRVGQVEIHRDEAVSCSGCPGGASITFDVRATDDATPTERIGYQLAVVRGAPPRDLLKAFDGQPISAPGGTARLPFTDDGNELDLELEVRAVDLNGNLGPPEIVRIADEAGACAAGTGRHPLATWGLAIAALALVVGRRCAKR